MTRIPFSLLGGVALALLLFWLLALLVTPPEEEFDVLDVSMTMSMVEAPETVQEEPAESSAEPPPPQVEASPPPQPEPLPPLESTIAMPEPELPPEPVEPLEFDSSLPELAEMQPEPPPEPAPEPQNEPEPAPEPAPQPAPTPEPNPSPTSPSAAPAPGPTTEQAASAEQGPVDVGQIAPTSRVPPEYPSRAQRRGLEGHVELQFLIRPDGSVDRSSIRVVESQPRNVFDSAAEQAVAGWQFEPANGVRRARQRLEFQLR
ncbi:energy transducer TonB [Billgrantia montanilacus]|uniref:Protein TonB n=1 Tax=Billgrantia montanilacus TaxID=2282305 RepID=A0A368TTC7_9GAMM|nr:energy transducer TonB [Halomonas montanilacus]RCV87352.1 energy transducer TonB [Halomonas montanilacus]